MGTKSKVILVLLIIGLSLFGIVQGIVLPNMKENKEQYARDQQEPVTHHFEESLPYENLYMGDASNTMNLFHSLPLNNIEKSFQLDSEEYSVEVIYNGKISEIGSEKIEKSVVYNATAAFVLIDNVEAVQFNFIDGDYEFSRSKVSEGYEIPLAELAEVEVWDREVQTKLNDPDYIQYFLE